MRCDEGKTRYESHAEATKMTIVIFASITEKQARGSAMNKKPPIRVYRCPFCQQWHITSQPARRSRVTRRAAGEAS